MKVHCFRGFVRTGSVLVFSAGVVAGILDSAIAGVVQGTLCTTKGDSITSDQLRDWIDELIPGGNQRLLVMTQCYGGNSATSFSGSGGTSVVSATSAGQTAVYGGYDNDAAGALAPGAGNTGATVHAAGTAGKHASETPSTGGGAAAGGFSLAPVPAAPAPADPIHSRHVLVYAGIPDGGGGTSDVAQRNQIAANFAGQPNTTVTSVGGAGGGGWNHAGSAAGLRQALKDIGTTIAGSPQPTKEQFIMYITDHGDLHNKESKEVVTGINQTVPLTPSAPFRTFTPVELPPTHLAQDPSNSAGFSVFLPFHDGSSSIFTAPESALPYFPANCWQLNLDNTSPSGADYLLGNSSDLMLELNGNGIVGDFPGEGIRVNFGLPHPDTSSLFIDSFFDVFYNVSLSNFTNFSTHPGNYLVGEFSQDTGNIAKVPEPSTTVFAAVAVLASLRRRRV